jgi:hypothetical protein
LVLGVVLVLFGVGWLLESLDVDVPWDVVFPAVLIGIGELVVIVPEGAAVWVEAHAGLGSVRVDDVEEAGIDAELSVPAPGAAPSIRLEASVGIGEVRIEHV